MAVNVQSLCCPGCGAPITPIGGEDPKFCQFCGARLAVTNENEHVYRQIDEAELKRADTEKLIQLRQLELEQQRLELDREMRMREYDLEEKRIKNDRRFDARITRPYDSGPKLTSSIIFLGVGLALLFVSPFVGAIPLVIGIIKLLRAIIRFFS